MSDLFEQLSEDLSAATNSELIRQAEIEAEIKQTQADD